MKKSALYISILLTISCTKTKLDPTGYAQWVENEENGLKVQRKTGNFEFELQYKPADYMVLMEQKKKVTARSLEQRKRELGAMQHYTLKIKALDQTRDILRSGITDERQYYERLEYFMSYMQDDISLVEGTDTLPCLLFHFERNYGLAPYSSMVLAFESDTIKKQQVPDRTFVYNDPVLGTGVVELSIKGRSIANCPALKTGY